MISKTRGRDNSCPLRYDNTIIPEGSREGHVIYNFRFVPPVHGISSYFNIDMMMTLGVSGVVRCTQSTNRYNYLSPLWLMRFELRLSVL